MGTITRRSIRRLGAAKKGVPTLRSVLQELAKAKRPSKLEGTRTHSPWGERILVMITNFRRSQVLTFRHPTKRATRGRLCSLTI